MRKYYIARNEKKDLWFIKEGKYIYKVFYSELAAETWLYEYELKHEK
jgi:hypothetical protein